MSDQNEPAIRLKDLSVDEYGRIVTLLNEALDLSPAERDEWLAKLDPEDPRAAALLRRLFAPLNVNAANQFFESRDWLISTFTAHIQDEQALKGRCFGPYRILSLLGHGGMGAVWLAQRADGLFERRVALKLLHPAVIGHIARERFAREREILATLSHPNIARLLDAGFSEDDQPFLALEYIDGTSITAYCDDHRLDLRKRLDLFLQVAGAVQYAHANLVIHRDLKPSNILVTHDGQVRLLDFGIAKLLTAGDTQETELTQLGGRALTPDYAAPEQIAGEPITTAADVYSLGVIFYELLTGCQPYRLKRDTRGALEEAILAIEPALPSQVAGDQGKAQQRGSIARKLAATLRGDLDTIALKALKKSPLERYPTVNAFAEDIVRYQSGEPVTARPDGVWYRIHKLVMRHRFAVFAAALIFVSLTTGLTLALLEAREARKERARAERVKDFIASIFDSASPYVGGKSNLTVRDLLKVGAERVEHELSDDPSTAAELLSLLSSSYLDLGDIDIALGTARKAQWLSERASDEPDEVRAHILRVLGRAASDKGNTTEARKFLEDAVSLQRRLGDKDIAGLALSLNELSGVVTSQGNLSSAIAMSREAVELMLHTKGDKDPLTIELMGELSNRLMIGQHAVEALAYADRAYKATLATFRNPDQPAVVKQLSNYAYALEATGQFKAAEAQWQRVLEADRKTFNPLSPPVAMALVGLGRARERSGELKESLANYEESLTVMKGYGATTGSELAIRYFTIGHAALFARQPELAVSSLTEAIAQGSQAYGRDSSRVHDAQDLRAASLTYGGDLEAADRILVERIAQDRSTHAPSLPALLRYRSLLERARGNAAASLSAAQEAWDTLMATEDPPPRVQGQTLSTLGQAQLDAHNVAPAAESLERAIPMLLEAQSLPTPQQADAWVALGRARLELRQFDEAQRWLFTAAGFWEKFDPDNVFGGEAAFWYAQTLVAKGQSSLARQQLLRATQLLEASTWPIHRELLRRAQAELAGKSPAK